MATSSTQNINELSEAIGKIGIHDHACLIYEDQSELLEIIIAYFIYGLNVNDRCVYFGSSEMSNAIIEGLEAAGCDTKTAIANEQLIVSLDKNMILTDNRFDVNGLVHTIDAAIGRARDRGFRALRCIGQIDWNSYPEVTPEIVTRYETQINRVLHTRDCIGICQYKVSNYTADILGQIVLAHPLVIYKGKVCRNPNYISPENFDDTLDSNTQLLQRVSQWEDILSAAEDRDRANESLSNAMAELSVIHANVPVAMMLIDHDVQVVKVNENAAHFAGCQSENLIGLRGGEVIHCLNHLAAADGCGTDEKCSECVLRNTVLDTLKTGNTHSNVEAWMRVQTENGEKQKRCLLISTSYLELGNQGRVLLCVQDITDIKLSEERILAAEHRYRTILDTSPMAVFLLREDRYIYANQAAARTLGYKDASELVGMTVDQIVDPAQVQTIYERIVAVKDGRSNPPLVLGLVTSDGGTIISESVSVPIQLADGPAILVVGHDITERIDALRALDESEQRFKSILEAVDLYAVILNREGKITFANPYLCQETGRTASELKDQNWFDIALPEQDKDTLRTFFDKSLKAGEMLAHKEGRILTSDGHERMVAWNNVILRDISGKVTGTASLGRDITDHRRLEEQYMQAQKMEAVGQLAAGIAHDFNNQLTVIQGYCEMLMFNRSPDDPDWKALSEIHDASQRAHSTTSHLLSFSRRQLLRPEMVYIDELLKSIRGPVSKMIGEDIRLTLIAEPGLPPVRIDRAGMHQAMMNLIVNARDAMPTGGELLLRSELVHLQGNPPEDFPNANAGSYVQIEIADTGTGMDAETAQKLFEPFFTTKEVGKGTGLGLPMVEGFVRQSNGYIAVQSELGNGTRFRILLPPCQHTESTEKTGESPKHIPGPRGAESILVVEDEYGVRGMMTNALRASGYKVFEASCPSEAISIAAKTEQKFELLITDMVMPEMNGKDLAKKLIGNQESLKVVFVTGYTSADFSDAPGPVLLKPFNAARLVTAVRETLDKPAE